MSASPKKKEGWRGILFTALLCGLFLWWWFQPVPPPPGAPHDPLHWVGLARQDLDGQPPTAAMRLEAVMIAEAVRLRGDDFAAAKIEEDWLPPAWRPAPNGAPPATPPGSPVFEHARETFIQAAAAIDQLEIEKGESLLREAAAQAQRQAEPQRGGLLWWTASQQARHGFVESAAATRAAIAETALPASAPLWLVQELLLSDMGAPTLQWFAARAEDDAEALAAVHFWRTLIRERLQQNDQSLLAAAGPYADASAADESAMLGRPALHRLVQANDMAAVQARFPAKNLPPDAAAQRLSIARSMAWLSPAAP